LSRYLLAAADPGAGVTDANLARRFIDCRDETAFELLVRRHAETVWSVCLRMLPRDQHSAEDAFQATFLALARKAGTIRGSSFGGWLYRVAVHAASRARERAGPARPQAEFDPPAPLVEPDRAELCVVVHEELAGLKEKYRLPVVLCDLSGLTHAEAAARLGWPVGTVSGRLSLARTQLRERLRRRGVVASAVLVASLVGGPTASARLVGATVGFVSGGSVPPAVVSLTEGVLSAMKWANLKPIVFAVTTFAAIGGMTTLAICQQADRLAAPPSSEVKASEVKPAVEPDPAWNTSSAPSAFPNIQPTGSLFPGMTRVSVLVADTPLRKLQKTRLNLLLAEFEIATNRVRVGAMTESELRQYYPKLAAAASEVFDRPADLRPWVEAWVGAMKAEEKHAEQTARAGAASATELFAVRRARIVAEIALVKLPRE
jgi:RNA polymerase sigma factor (sigma-70 family)